MVLSRRVLSAIFFVLWALPSAWALAAKPELLLAKNYDDSVVVEDYWISEKLDGVRARWNGSELVSRGGHVFAAPDWFIAGFPNQVLDGELWSQRGAYERISSVTARDKSHEGWRELTFMVFDMPEYGGNFSQRVAAMRRLSSPHLKPVEQLRLSSNAALSQMMDKVVAGGGEGLMLHHQDALYQSGRSHQLLKLKRFEDAEATVIGYRSGKGKYAGLMGSINVRDARGVAFYIGSGFSDADRKTPPAIGSLVTFKHQGYTAKGVPRFPVFLRLRDER